MPEIIETQIEKEMQSSYIDYAMSVIVGRALPDARDGLKPVQRRILYAMYKLNNVYSQQTKKSARIVGEVMGKYHPHGDMAIYDALVRMAQPFTMKHTLVSGQGNMGSIDGDPPAAQRYTEVKLSKIAEEMLNDLEKESVKFTQNFDNTEVEPVVLPAKLPNLLLNGSSGIAVGVATNILPHNINEVCDAISAFVDNREIKPEDLMSYIKGPDFPTGGIVFYNNQLYSSYMTGRGSVTIRGKTETEETKTRKSIIITEIPYNVNKAILAETIGRLIRDKIIQGIADIRDESSKDDIRLVLDLKKDVSVDYVLNLLYKHTQLQITSPVMNIAVLNNALLTMNIRQFIKVFVDHRFDVITKRTAYDLNVAKDRMHIVKGLVIAMENIDEVVSLIKSSQDTKDARFALMEKYELSEKQASAILDMKLSRLTSLEVSSLKSEEKNLEIKIDELTSILADNSKVYHIIKEETLHIKNTYGIERKTKIEISELPPTIENEDLIEDMDITILLTNNNYLKRMNMKSYKVQDRGGRGIKAIELKDGDFAKQTLYCKNKDTLMVFSNLGRAYWIKAYMVPEGDRYSSGKAAINLIKMRDGEHIERVINTKEFIGKFITFVTSKGVIKRIRGEKFAKPRSNGINAIPLRDTDSLADVCISNGESQIFLSTKSGKSIRFNESDIRPMSRMAHGIRGIRLKDKDSVVNIISVSEKDYVMSITEKGYGKITELDKYRLQYRGGSGVLNIKISDKTGMVVKSLKVSENDTALLISSNGISIQFPVSSVRKTGRAASGVRIMRLDAKNSVVDAQIISPDLVDPNQNAIIESDSNEADGNI